MKITVLSDDTFYFSPAMLIKIEEAAPGCELIYRSAASVTATQLADSEIIFGCPPVAFLRDAARLKWHHLPNAAIQPYTSLAIYANSDVMFTNSSGVYGPCIAEHVVAYVFSFARCLPLYARQQRENIWQRDDGGTVSVDGSTVAVFGMGDLGKHISQKLKALGAHIIGIRRSLLEKPTYVDEMYDMRAMDAVLVRADFTVCCLPLTNTTRGLFSQRAFAAMKRRSFFINVGRGAIIDNDALVDALNSGILSGAALDVTNPEPLPDGHVLWGMENVIITPHSSCVSSDIQERKLELFLELLERYQRGRRLKNIVSFMQGY